MGIGRFRLSNTGFGGAISIDGAEDGEGSLMP